MLRKARWAPALRIGATVALLGASAAEVAVGLAVRTGRLDLKPELGGSMRPSFQPGDLVASWQVPVSSRRVGDPSGFADLTISSRPPRQRAQLRFIGPGQWG
jgi:hypothetical protein